MSLELVTGLSALILGIGYNKAYKAYTNNKINLNCIKQEPRDTRPRPEFYYTLKDVSEFEEAEHNWNKYNSIRRYYLRLMDEISKEIPINRNNFFRQSEFWIHERGFKDRIYGVVEGSDSYNETKKQCSDISVASNAFSLSGFCGGGAVQEQHHLFLDKRFEDIYKEMLSQGVSLEFRPGIDYLSRAYWSKGILGGESKGWSQSLIELISEGLDADTLNGFKYIFTEYGLDNVHMDYKRFYKPQYIS